MIDSVNPTLQFQVNNLFPEKPLVLDVVLKIFQDFNIKEVGGFSFVSKNWKDLTEALFKKLIYEKLCFKPADWNLSFKSEVVKISDIGKIFQSLPENIKEILTRPCPFFKEKRVMETHMLVWIPASINGQPVTIRNFGILLKDRLEFSKNDTGYGFIWDSLLNIEGDKPIPSGFVLMTKENLPNSANKEFFDQKQMIDDYNIINGTNYKIPKVGEAIICILAEYLKSGMRLFSDNQMTRCSQNVNCLIMSVGGFSTNGIRAGYNTRNTIDWYIPGVTALARL